MKKRFIVAVEGLTNKEQKLLSAFLAKEGAWWHWIDGFWMIVVSGGSSLDTVAIRDKVKEIGDNPHCIVLQVQGSVSWAGFGPSSDERNMFSWLRNTWSRYND
ncbi:MAG: hypothetical protein F4Y60_02580 [Boseongicola sp. SB0664_bin_43]|uniref:Uncharacterized protein n=1 Tax=Boseongicola sp. SB0664_bin_43 TaxID=2604844 RepID=A0A6B0XWQ0_9RHOB|nr:hypothetical protein [Boseongicola sp. SB0664_bin_43]MYG83669.1 hypothetical protein [Gemmatimonadota bacterium]